MTNTIQPYMQLPAMDAASPPPPAAKPQPSTVSQTGQADSVTLSEAAQTNAALVSAARGATGVNQQNINTIKAALANGSYNVSPENLAQAISTVLSETPR
ncbi:MAG: flagellar biosynthesis anti-sigma factor FlgM [Rhodospirillales bacterium]|nr:flagellar biosynthesis anti-sigma factor FlgM [Rhodospirillales bacterium]